MYVCIYIYTYDIGREREREIYIYIYTYIYIYIYIYIYMCSYESENQGLPWSGQSVRICPKSEPKLGGVTNFQSQFSRRAVSPGIVA